ncbi:hypothetical protein GCM10009670_25780 [Citricoccus alkalitolerans]
MQVLGGGRDRAEFSDRREVFQLPEGDGHSRLLGQAVDIWARTNPAIDDASTAGSRVPHLA